MAVQMSPTDLAQLIEQITMRVTETMGKQFDQRQEESANKERHPERRSQKLDERVFRRVDKFLGGEKEWRDFKFDVEVIVQTIHPELAGIMKDIHRADIALMKTTGDYDRIKQASKELYEMLCILTGGQAKLIVRSVEAQCGLAAWSILHGTYAQQTLARTIRTYRAAINPDQANSLDEIISAISNWETCVKEAEQEDEQTVKQELRSSAILAQDLRLANLAAI